MLFLIIILVLLYFVFVSSISLFLIIYALSKVSLLGRVISIFWMLLNVNGFMLCPVCLPSVVLQLPLLVYRLSVAVMIAHKRVYTIICEKMIALQSDDVDITSKFFTMHYGGYKQCAITFSDIKDYIIDDVCASEDLTSSNFQFLDHVDPSNSEMYSDNQYLHVHLPLHVLASLVSLTVSRKIAAEHEIPAGSHTTRPMIKSLFEAHTCKKCSSYRTIFAIQASKKSTKRKELVCEQTRNRVAAHRMQRKITESEQGLEAVFPPAPLDKVLSQQVINSACKKLDPKSFEEAGCAVCGQLISISELSRLSAIKNYLKILEVPGVTRQERKTMNDKLQEYPCAIDHSCRNVCNLCHTSLRNGKVPRFALANGLWLGPVPEILSSLHYFEKMLVARIRHSYCSVKIASGMRKMRAHAISYQQPIPKVYNMLPPPKADIEEVIAIMFTGPSKPTPADFLRTPFLVRCNKVKLALEWLILNHSDYEDVIISQENLNEYPEDMPPVSIEYKPMMHNKTPEGTSVHDMEEEDGTEHGQCAFTVHGLTGEQLDIMTANAVKAKALQHLNSGGKFLAIAHDEQPESIWHNPQLYPQMFPWLFPYGLGGVGSVPGIPEKNHKKWLLLYHDKRFQMDQNFPFVAFSHEQIKTTSSQSFLLADKKIFDDIKNRILNIDRTALASLLERLARDEVVKAETEQEQQCFHLLKDLDHVSGPVKGSNTSKKWMRSEIWSLIYHRGAPFWYITISPADIKHPLCIYYADGKEKFSADILPYDTRLRLICQNPVAGACFFDFMVHLFISEILGVDSERRGIYGDVPAYYGTVEQQGRLTLHLHMLIWLKGNLTPQEMRNRILDPNSTWRKQLIVWLESCHCGEFVTGTQDNVLANIAERTKSGDYRDPTEILPQPAPPLCALKHDSYDNCPNCNKWNTWWDSFKHTVDDLVSKSNIHNCDRGINKDGSLSKKYASCKDNKYGKCKARFPRATFNCTEVDPATGSLNIKKHEAWINFYTPLLTYILCCNTDVTCLWSGTALKAVIMYVTDYITKTGLKTHVMFEAIRNVFDKHHEVLSSSLSEKEKARKMMNKIVNALSVKSEMGGPMVCMYLLNNPDHYTNHTFIPFYWYSFVAEAQKAWEPQKTEETEKVTLVRTKKRIVGISPVYDYIYRPSELDDMTLYDWVLKCKRQKYRLNHHKKNAAYNADETEDETETETDITSHEDSNPCGSDTVQVLEDCLPSNLPRNMYKFRNKHPLFETHVTVVVQKQKPNVAVNFIGRILPRCDQGDRELYCLTMLALFKPWRSGFDLKPEQLSWDETFCGHEFTKQQQQLMKNFNIKYECLDARDDFRAQMVAGAVPNEWVIGNLEDHLNDDEFNHENDPFVELNASEFPDDPDSLSFSKSELKRQKEAGEIRDVLRRTGWLDQSTVVSKLDLVPFVPQRKLPAATWKSILQAKKQMIIEQKVPSTSTKSNTAEVQSFTPNVVQVVDKGYLERKYHTTEHNTFIDSICSDYSLNEEQERAFRIIANHVVLPNSEPLKMYIGGMGGTGKSQVLKAVSTFFEKRNEAYRFIIVAPTGTAAALLSGATYHSVFGINDLNNSEAQTTKTLIQVHSRLQGVDYIFMDEVSMLSCHDMYKISAQLCKVMNDPTTPFGGYNMLFAGDFAQLPPPVGGENVLLYSRMVGLSGTDKNSQEESLGRALWHQVVTVVILRQNMRQKIQSKNDDKLQKALENMRYKDCTPSDIQFLKTQITSTIPGRPSITATEFKYVSIITAKNAQKMK